MSFLLYNFDDDLIAVAQADGQAHLKIYPFDHVAVVLGRGSKPALEIYEERCKEDGIPIYRRHGGGCAVLLDPGNLIVSLALPVNGIGDNNKHFKRISSWVIKGLEKLGVQGVYHDGISDFVLVGKKIGGSCIYRRPGILYYSSTLLIDPKLDLVERYLKHPPKEPEYRKGRGHGEFMGKLLILSNPTVSSQLTEKLALGANKENFLRNFS